MTTGAAFADALAAPASARAWKSSRAFRTVTWPLDAGWEATRYKTGSKSAISARALWVAKQLREHLAIELGRDFAGALAKVGQHHKTT